VYLRITATGVDAEGLSHLLAKHPAKAHVRELPRAEGRLFFPEYGPGRATAFLYFRPDPLALTREAPRGFGIHDYIHDQEHTFGSFACSWTKKVLGSAAAGRCPERPELADRELVLELEVGPLACGVDGDAIRSLWEPLGWEVDVRGLAGTGEGILLGLSGRSTVADALRQILILVPVMDRRRHFYAGKAELEKLERHATGWIEGHPERDRIVRRFLA
jgi:hypothetical protein